MPPGILLAALLAAPPAVTPALARIVELRPLDGRRGPGCHATPVGVVQLLTAAHCVGEGVVEWSGQGLRGTARVMWHDPKRDLAMFAVDLPAPRWATVPIGARKPSPLDRLYWRRYVPRLVSQPASGEFGGFDSDGDMALTGPVTYGSSGSGVLNEAGELVGVMSVVYNPVTVGKRPQTTHGALLLAWEAVHVMPQAGAKPVNEWPKP